MGCDQAGAGPPGRGRHVEDGPSPRAASQCASNRIKPILYVQKRQNQTQLDVTNSYDQIWSQLDIYTKPAIKY